LEIANELDPLVNDALGDLDGDGISNNIDNCPNASNPDQQNSDPDFPGDACDPCLSHEGDACYYLLSVQVLSTSEDGSGVVTVESESGTNACSSSCQYSYPEGAVLTLMATPSSDALFEGWSGNCSGVGACTLTMDRDYSVTATFGPRIISTFTDDPIQARETWVKGTHIYELREAINNLRGVYGLEVATYTDPTCDEEGCLREGITEVKAVHVMELRAALDEIYDQLDQPRPNYTDSTLKGTLIQGVHINELRTAIHALE
jgi:hypothetical protein